MTKKKNDPVLITFNRASDYSVEFDTTDEKKQYKVNLTLAVKLNDGEDSTNCAIFYDTKGKRILIDNQNVSVLNSKVHATSHKEVKGVKTIIKPIAKSTRSNS